MITIILLFSIAILGAHIADDIVCYGKAKRIAMSIFILLGLFSAGLMIKSVLVPGAEKVAVIHETYCSDKKELFQDTETGEYFVMLRNHWNPFEATYREYVNDEIAEEYVAKYNELKAIELP
jgi:hypothetical protein